MPAVFPSTDCSLYFEYPHPWEKNSFFKSETKRRKKMKRTETYPKHMTFWRLLDYTKFTDLPPPDPDALPPAPGDPPLERELPKDPYLYYVPKVLCRFNTGYNKKRIADHPKLKNKKGVDFIQLSFGHPWGTPHNPLPKPLHVLREETAKILAIRAAKKAEKAAKKAEKLARKMGR